MEGESTLGVLSGFVLGALTFHHLNTDSDTTFRNISHATGFLAFIIL
uniref:BRCA1 A complex subunit n=1 Tax=Mus musculus TaxID=10090 RepID=D6RHB0_MOUSE